MIKCLATIGVVILAWILAWILGWILGGIVCATVDEFLKSIQKSLFWHSLLGLQLHYSLVL
jgi:hypothetical protein